MDRDAITARAYLLGQLDESATEAVEGRYFEDAAFFDEVDAAADRLCDEYLQGALDAPDAARVRDLAAQRDDWRQRLRFAEAFRAEMAAPASAFAAVRPTPDERASFSLGAWLRSQALGMQFGLAAAVLAVALGWPLFALQMRRSQADLAALRSDLQPQVTTAEARATSAEAETTSLRNRVAALEQTMADQRTVSLVLMPGMSRGEGDTLVVPKDAAFVRFQLAVEREPQKDATFRAVLRTVERAVVWSQDEVRLPDGPDRSPVIQVPALALRPGQYELLLLASTAGATLQEIAVFSFQITRR